jgi:apolipoprotein N-acyltransferase
LILQLGKLSGFTTVTAAIVAVNGLIAESLLLIRQSRQNLAFLSLPLLICFSLHLWGWNTYHKPLEKSRDLGIKIGVIQGNIPNTIKLSPLGFQKALEGYTSGYQILADQGVDAVLTPETALPYYWENLVNNSSIYSAILAKKTPIWLGAFGKVDKGYNNSLLTIDGEGRVISRYDKVILVPLGEYVPFQEILGGIVDRLSPLQAHLIPGDPDQIINSPFGKIIVGICYESAFSEHFRRQTARGGEFIITASNNAHYSHAMPAQHHAQDTMRAIETDRWMARATNTGYSAFVDPHGNHLWLSDLDKYQIHSETIYRRDTRTLYVRWGDWLTKVLIITAGLAWLWRAWD